MDIEEMYMTLFGASRTGGAKYEVVEKWFKECEIIDELVITSYLFELSYARVRENKYDLTLVQFAQLLGILARETSQDLEVFGRRFRTVNQRIIDEIQASYELNEEKK